MEQAQPPSAIVANQTSWHQMHSHKMQDILVTEIPYNHPNGINGFRNFLQEIVALCIVECYDGTLVVYRLPQEVK